MNSTRAHDYLNAQNVTIDIKEVGNVYNLTLLNSLWRMIHIQIRYFSGKSNLTLEASKGTKKMLIVVNGAGATCDWDPCATSSILGVYSTTISRQTGTVNLVKQVIAGIKPSKLRPPPPATSGSVRRKDGGHCDNATLICQCNADHYGADCMLQTCLRAVVGAKRGAGRGPTGNTQTGSARE